MEETPDFSKAFETLQQMLSSGEGQSQIQNILSMFSGNQENNASPDPDSSSGSLIPAQNPSGSDDGIDFDTILKIQGIIQAMNSQKNNPKTAFLHALKPFLKKDRQAKLDQAAQIMSIAAVLKAFKNNDKGGV